MNYLKTIYLSSILEIAGQYPYFVIERTEEVLNILSEKNLDELKALYILKKEKELVRLCKTIENAVINFKMEKIVESLKKLQSLKNLDEEEIDTEIENILMEKMSFINEIADYKKNKNINP